jgi:hypothetical protein
LESSLSGGEPGGSVSSNKRGSREPGGSKWVVLSMSAKFHLFYASGSHLIVCDLGSQTYMLCNF